MKITKWFSRFGQGISRAALRFPLTILCLIAAAGMLCYIIRLDRDVPLILQKLVFTVLVGAMLGVAAEAVYERFQSVKKLRLLAYAAAVILNAGYLLLLLQAIKIDIEVTVRTLVAVFALLCIFIWIPSVKSKVNFNIVALTQFKAFFTTVLYTGVLWLGIFAIIASVNALLFSIHEHAYMYVSIIVWILFAPIYFLSILPLFHSAEPEEAEKSEHASRYPRFLEILVSYIAIPLITAYTAVLAAYFIKILVTMKWPSGQLGPMILIYSAVGLILYILASLLSNRFAVLYIKIFPIVLIPVVILQLVSVGIRLNAYGVTESRYYVALFGIFSLLCGVLLSVRKGHRNGIIAVLAAAFAVLSILPPVDAFSISRSSQIHRLESILEKQGMLQNGIVAPMPQASDDTKREVTNIVFYLNDRGYLSHVKWLPENFKPYDQMKTVFGFDAYYGGETIKFKSVNLNSEQPLAVTGFDVITNNFAGNMIKYSSPQSQIFTIRGISYHLSVSGSSNNDTKVTLSNSSGQNLVSVMLYDQAKLILDNTIDELLPQDKMAFEGKVGDYRLRIVFQNISENGTDITYSFYVLVAAPKGSAA